MIAWLRQSLDTFRGRGDAAATVPPMDGALRPNTRLDSAEIVLRIAAPDNLVAQDSELLFSSGPALHAFDPRSGSLRQLRRFEHPVASFASNGAGLLAVGLGDGSLHLWQPDSAETILSALSGTNLVCPSALAFRDAATLIVSEGSRQHAPEAWQHDLMAHSATGSVWELGVATGAARRLAGGLAYPHGVAVTSDAVVVSESWRHRLVRLVGDGAVPLLSDLPAYPSRLIPAPSGGYWLCAFAPRSQLIEFVLREPTYRARMMRDLDPAHWIAPTLSPPRSFLEPMQGGAIRTHGIVKPWSPTRSYGLLIRLDARFQPVASYHSRADGRHHGITSAVELGRTVFVASKGGDAILAVPLDDAATETVA